jgi:hypothetical protein
MPDRSIAERAKRDLRRGKSPSTAAGEFVHEEIEHVRRGKHGARSPQQAIAIGLSKARRAGVPLRPPKKGKAKESTRTSARRTHKKGQRGEDRKPSPRASRARKNVLKRESHRSASRGALASQTRRAARGPTSASKRAAAKKAVATKGKAGRQAAARKAARTPARRG